MSGEVKVGGFGTGQTNYFRILGSGNSIWSTSGGTGGFELYNAADWADYANSLTEQGSSNVYVGNFPLAVPPGVFDVIAHRQIGGTPAQSDIRVGEGEVNWQGTKRVPLSDLATSGQVGQIGPIRLARSDMVRNFPIYLRSSADHVTPLTSGVVSGQISRDGAAFGPLQSGAFTEVGQGTYSLQALTSGDLNAATIMLLFNAVGVSGGASDPLPIGIVTQRISGY